MQSEVEILGTQLNLLWVVIGAMLVIFMQAGFAMVETGFSREKNDANIMMKNLMDFSVGTLGFWALGFGLMFGVSSTGWFGTSGFFLSDHTPDGDPWVLAFWMFQVVFAARPMVGYKPARPCGSFSKPAVRAARAAAYCASKVAASRQTCMRSAACRFRALPARAIAIRVLREGGMRNSIRRIQ
jgi:hypothetical protein